MSKEELKSIDDYPGLAVKCPKWVDREDLIIPEPSGFVLKNDEDGHSGVGGVVKMKEFSLSRDVSHERSTVLLAATLTGVIASDPNADLTAEQIVACAYNIAEVAAAKLYGPGE